MTNSKQKEYQENYRRRLKAKGYIKKLKSLIQESNRKDAGLLMQKLDVLRYEAADKSGFFDDVIYDINEKGEMEEAGDEEDEEKRAMDRKFGGFAVGRYRCPTCKNLGYLLSPNLDAEDKDLELYMLHLNLPLEDSTFCQISSVPRHRLMIAALPTAGVLTITKPKGLSQTGEIETKK